jgi:ABC-type dipeptide/oligopeptide/nickel transport system ATPase component
VIADEITSAIDASLKATVLDLLQSRANEVGAAILLISHDLNAVRRICKRVGVMRQGELVEIGPTAAIIDSPRHSYTQRLIAALPELHRPRQPLLANFAGEAE